MPKNAEGTTANGMPTRLDVYDLMQDEDSFQTYCKNFRDEIPGALADMDYVVVFAHSQRKNVVLGAWSLSMSTAEKWGRDFVTTFMRGRMCVGGATSNFLRSPSADDKDDEFVDKQLSTVYNNPTRRLAFYIEYACTARIFGYKGVSRRILHDLQSFVENTYVNPLAAWVSERSALSEYEVKCYIKTHCILMLFSIDMSVPAWKKLGFMGRAGAPMHMWRRLFD